MLLFKPVTLKLNQKLLVALRPASSARENKTVSAKQKICKESEDVYNILSHYLFMQKYFKS